MTLSQPNLIKEADALKGLVRSLPSRKVRIMSEINETTQEIELTDLHPDHEKHLCHITSLRNMKTVGELAKDAKYVCIVCGRAAKSHLNLCEPGKI